MIRCVLQIFVTPSQGLCFDHVFNKTYQYVYNDINVCIGFLRNQFEDHTIRHTKNNDMDYEIRQMLEWAEKGMASCKVVQLKTKFFNENMVEIL